MNLTIGTNTFDVESPIKLASSRNCSTLSVPITATGKLSEFGVTWSGVRNPTDAIKANGYADFLASARNYINDSSLPLNEREAVARSVSAYANSVYQLLQDRQVYITNMDKAGFPCVVNCYGRPDCRWTRYNYNNSRTRAIDSAKSFLDVREEFNSVAETLSAQGDSLISDQEALSRLNRIQADSKQAQAEADQKALIADITRVGIAVVSVVAVFFLYKYIRKFVK